MSYVISINQNFARTLDEQAALRLAELSGTFAAFKYNLQGLPTRQEPHMFNIDHPFDWHTFDLFVGMFQPPGRLLDWAIDDVCEFVIHVQYCQLDSIGKSRSAIRPTCYLANREIFGRSEK